MINNKYQTILFCTFFYRMKSLSHWSRHLTLIKIY